MENHMNTNKRVIRHLCISDRVYIEQSLYQGKTFKEIASFLDKDVTTISKEIKRFIKWNNGVGARKPGSDCKNRDTCEQEDLCFIQCGRYCKDCESAYCSAYCPYFEPTECPHLKKAPYVCNGCLGETTCGYTKYFYTASTAEERYQEMLRTSRTGINITPEKLRELDELISPLIKNGQSLGHIFAAHGDEIPCSRSTIYNYLDQGLFDVKNIDLPRRVRYKLRKKQISGASNKYAYRNNRTFADYQKYSAHHPDYEVIEMDTVKGTRESGKCLLTLFFRNSSFMLVFVLPSCSQQSVKEVFDYLYTQLGASTFKQTFRILLTDNGPEFKDPEGIEKAINGKARTKVFYCDPLVSNQKSRLERNHEYIRYIIPKGKSMYFLNNEHARLLMQHINSVARDGLNGKTPFDLAELLINKKVLTLLGLSKVSPDDVILRPTLLKK